MAYTPGGNDLVNTLQNEDVLTGNTLAGATSLTGTLGNANDQGYNVVAPSMTNVQTVNIAFTNTFTGFTLDFQDITGTTTANMTRISNNFRDSFTNLSVETVNLGVANTSEQAKATFSFLNNELASASNAVTLTLNNASLSGTQAEYDLAEGGAALKVIATDARGSDLQHQIETYNIVTAGSVGSTVATFKTGVSSFDDNVVGQRPVTINVATGSTASLAVGTMRWLGNRVETNSANTFQASFNSLHQVGTNGVGFVDVSQIRTINVTGASDVTLANVGTWVNLDPTAASVNSINFTLNAATLAGNLTANLTNAASSIYTTITGGLGLDRFYVSGADTAASGTPPVIIPFAVNVVAQINGGAALDTLTVQSNAGGTVNLAAGSTGVEVLNLVQGIATTATPGAWTIDLADGGFEYLTFNNQDAVSIMSNTLTNFNATTTDLSIRSNQLTTNGDTATTLAPAVNIAFTQTAGLVGGTLSLELGAASDDRALSDAFSYRNYTDTVGLTDNGAQGTTEVASLNLVVNTAGEAGTGAAQINVVNDDFETSTTLTSAIAATNTVNIGFQQAANVSTGYTSNALNSTTYNGSAYTGTQNVTFGAASAFTAVSGKSINWTTGSANSDTVDLSFMTTSADRTATGYALSSWLLGSVVNLGGGTGDELILSATLADPRQVLNADITYDGYFANWSNVDILTINNRNAMDVSGGTLSNAETTAYVAVDAYAQINNSGLNTFNFNDVSGELAVGFRFTNNITIATDSTSTVATKWTTLNSFSSGNNTVNIDASVGISNGVGNLVQYTNTGANLANQVNLNYDNITNAGIDIDNATADELIVLNGGSLDIVDFDGDLGNVALTAAGNLTFVADNTYTATGVATTYDFTGVGNTIGTAIATLTMNAAAEVNALGLTIYGSTDGGSATAGVNNVITGGASVANTITSAGYRDQLTGGSAADSITYTGNAGVATNSVVITAGAGADTITISAGTMIAGETATVNAGAGNDVVSLGLETDTYIFANVATVAITPAASVAQTVLNVGSDTISSYQTATDVFQLSTTVFGTSIGANTAAFATDHYQQVTSTIALVGALTIGGIVVVQAAENANASIYYVDRTVVTGVNSVDQLVQQGNATLIGQVSNVTGGFAAGEFAVIS